MAKVLIYGRLIDVSELIETRNGSVLTKFLVKELDSDNALEITAFKDDALIVFNKKDYLNNDVIYISVLCSIKANFYNNKTFINLIANNVEFLNEVTESYNKEGNIDEVTEKSFIYDPNAEIKMKQKDIKAEEFRRKFGDLKI